MFFYALTIHPFLKKLPDILCQEGFNKCFADDLAVHTPFENDSSYPVYSTRRTKKQNMVIFLIYNSELI